MYKAIISTSAFLFMLAQSTNTLAGDGATATISLTEGIVVNKTSAETKENTKEDIDEKVDEIKSTENEDSGFMSFLTFSFMKNDKVVQPQKDETKESFMERMYRQAEEGNVDALLNLGYMSLYGLNGVEINYKKAFEYYSLAAQSGDDVAINNLGSLYYSGVGVRKNITKAAELFAKASDLGNTEASLNLAVIYLSQKDSLGNTAEAIALLKKVAEDNNPTGKYLLGYAYLKGIGVPLNTKKAVENIRFAADKNYDEAQFIMGHLYEHGIGVPQNYNNALRYLNRAAQQGNVSAINELGEIYTLGTKVEKDLYKAHVMYNLATFYGVPGASKKRDVLEKQLKIPELLQAQTEAENFTPKPSKLTTYIKSTFGNSLALYIDPRAPVIKN